MGRAILGIILGSGLGALAGNAALQQYFGVSLEQLWSEVDDRGPVYGAALALPIFYLLVRGWIGHLVTMLLISAGVAMALKYGLQDHAPWSQVLTLSAIYGVVAVGVYRMLVSRVLG